MSFSKNILNKMMCWEILHIHFKSYQDSGLGEKHFALTRLS